MELILQRGLPHQQKAVDAISAALNGVQITSPVQFYENPSISLSDPKLAANIREIQKIYLQNIEAVCLLMTA